MQDLLASGFEKERKRKFFFQCDVKSHVKALTDVIAEEAEFGRRPEEQKKQNGLSMTEMEEESEKKQVQTEKRSSRTSSKEQSKSSM